MDRIAGTEVRSVNCGEEIEEIGVDSLQFGEEIRRLMAAPPDTGSSFTALLELPANQVMELLNSPDTVRTQASLAGDHHVIEQASRFSVFPAAVMSTETSSIPSNSTPHSHVVKLEPVNSDSNPNSSDPMTENDNRKSTKRKEREKKGTGSTKKSKSVANENSGDGEKLPYVHVRARRGQATDSHSLAERARREKINARMKLLQELVPGCNKISGTAMVLDEIINHVQSLQHQVELLSMRLAAINPRIDVNLDSLLDAESGSSMDTNIPGMVMPMMWPEGQGYGNRQQYHQLWHFDGLHQPVLGREDNASFITPETSLLSYDSSKDSVTVPTSLHSHASSVPVLVGSNFSEWYEHIQFTLGVMDLDMALLVEKPMDINDESTVEQVSHVNLWERSNRLSLMFMKMTIANNIKTSLPQTSNALEYLKAVKDRFKSADKSLAGTIMAELTTMKYDGNRGVQEHILNMSDKAAKLASLGMQVDESFLVHRGVKRARRAVPCHFSSVPTVLRAVLCRAHLLNVPCRAVP